MAGAIDIVCNPGYGIDEIEACHCQCGCVFVPHQAIGNAALFYLFQVILDYSNNWIFIYSAHSTILWGY